MELGSVDTGLYSCITRNIATDRVMITREQLAHIESHHPEAYDEMLSHLPVALRDPDYIFEDTTHDLTGLVVRKINDKKEYLLAVLRISIVKDDTHCNTVISGWKVSQRRLENYLRNAKVLYRRPEE